MLYQLADPLVDIAYDVGMTPNFVTGLSFVFACLSLRAFHAGHGVSAVVFWFLAYLMDVIDGMEARRYNMETVIGDQLDHQSDVIGYVGFVLIAWTYVKAGASVWPLMATVGLGLAATYFLTCQQLYDDGRNIAINGLGRFPAQCRSVKEMHTLRWFGVGTCNLAILGAIYYYCTHRT